MPLIVIGAGLCRTGTSSLREAIDKLGLGPCYHMKGVFEHDDPAAWIAVHEAVKAGASNEELKQMFEDIWKKEDREYQSAVDYPSQVYYKQLAEIYPDAKVILTERDSPAQWYKSTHDTVGAPTLHTDAQQSSDFQKMLSMLAWDNPDTFSGRMHAGDQEFCERVYTAWNEEVKRSIPKERLLVFNAKEGWQPLCKFLGVPVPDEDYPKVWTSDDFRAFVAQRQAGASAVE